VFFLKVRKNVNGSFQLEIFDENLSKLEENSFADNFEFNFYIQTWQQKTHFPKTLLVIHDIKKNSSEIQLVEKKEIFL